MTKIAVNFVSAELEDFKYERRRSDIRTYFTITRVVVWESAGSSYDIQGVT